MDERTGEDVIYAKQPPAPRGPLRRHAGSVPDKLALLPGCSQSSVARDLGSKGKAIATPAAYIGHSCWTVWGEVDLDGPSHLLLDPRPAGMVGRHVPGGSSVLQSLFPESNIAVRFSAHPPPKPQARLLEAR